MKRDTGIYSKKQVDSAMLCITKITLRFPLNPDLLQQNKRIVGGGNPIPRALRTGAAHSVSDGRGTPCSRFCFVCLMSVRAMARDTPQAAP